MSAIPEDISKTAAVVWATLPLESAGIIPIARAILAERQRCAEVAQREGDGYKEAGLPQSAMGAYTTRRAILA